MPNSFKIVKLQVRPLDQLTKFGNTKEVRTENNECERVPDQFKLSIDDNFGTVQFANEVGSTVLYEVLQQQKGVL